jgi:hypothetical protein
LIEHVDVGQTAKILQYLGLTGGMQAMASVVDRYSRNLETAGVSADGVTLLQHHHVCLRFL